MPAPNDPARLDGHPAALAPVNPIGLIQTAIERGIEPAQLEKLMDLQERYERNRAAETFARALAAFQAECPPIKKDRRADVGGKYTYRFASYDDVMAGAGPVLARHAIAVSFNSRPTPQGIEVACRVRVGTHTEETTVTVPVPGMNVNETQKYGAALSYAKRFAVCAALNIVVTDEDSDAVALDFVTAAQAAEIEELIAEKGANLKRFLEWVGAESVDKIHAANFDKAVDTLRRYSRTAAPAPGAKGGGR